MIYIVGASSLAGTIKSIPYRERGLHNKTKNRTYALSGLSLNPRVTNPLKRLQYLLTKGRLSRTSNIVVWHDIINNTINRHPRGKPDPLSIGELISLLKQWKHRISAIVYTKRAGSKDILKELYSSKIRIINARQHLLSARQRREFQPCELQKLHPDHTLERELVTSLWNRKNSLRQITRNKRSKKAKSKRKRIAKRKQREDVQVS